MTLKGNYHFMFFTQLLSGILTYFACIKFGINGVLIGFLPFLASLLIVHINFEPDERELSLIHKTDSIQMIGVALIMTLTYFFFPKLDWFFIFVSSISIIRAIIGLFLFTFK